MATVSPKPPQDLLTLTVTGQASAVAVAMLGGSGAFVRPLLEMNLWSPLALSPQSYRSRVTVFAFLLLIAIGAGRKRTFDMYTEPLGYISLHAEQAHPGSNHLISKDC